MTERYGIYRGVVADASDPENLGRLRVLVPSVLGRVPTGWAWPCAPSDDAVTVPALGAGVWVQFEGGNVESPVWVGTWINQGYVPPEEEPPFEVPDIYVLRAGDTVTGSLAVNEKTTAPFLASLAPDVGDVEELVENGDFEDGTVDGWSVTSADGVIGPSADGDGYGGTGYAMVISPGTSSATVVEVESTDMAPPDHVQALRVRADPGVGDYTTATLVPTKLLAKWYDIDDNVICVESITGVTRKQTLYPWWGTWDVVITRPDGGAYFHLVIQAHFPVGPLGSDSYVLLDNISCVPVTSVVADVLVGRGAEPYEEDANHNTSLLHVDGAVQRPYRNIGWTHWNGYEDITGTTGGDEDPGGNYHGTDGWQPIFQAGTLSLDADSVFLAVQCEQTAGPASGELRLREYWSDTASLQVAVSTGDGRVTRYFWWRHGLAGPHNPDSPIGREFLFILEGNVWSEDSGDSGTMRVWWPETNLVIIDSHDPNLPVHPDLFGAYQGVSPVPGA